MNEFLHGWFAIQTAMNGIFSACYPKDGLLLSFWGLKMGLFSWVVFKGSGFFLRGAGSWGS